MTGGRSAGAARSTSLTSSLCPIGGARGYPLPGSASPSPVAGREAPEQLDQLVPVGPCDGRLLAVNLGAPGRLCAGSRLDDECRQTDHCLERPASRVLCPAGDG